MFKKGREEATEELLKFNTLVSKSFGERGSGGSTNSITANQVRTRYAPSPTGDMHIGGLRTALFNYLFARQHNGKFLLRIEDTDKKREVDGSIPDIIESLKWAGLDYNEGPGLEVEGEHGPYFQSQRIETYHRFADTLLEVSTFVLI
jgi:glutamyl/glutaminyl-tRNA synthetase